jgi:hypothetical protein
VEAGGLVDRDTEIGQFQDFITHPGEPWLLVFYGLAGLGKTTLLRHLNHTLGEGYLGLWLDFEESRLRNDFYGLLTELDRALERAGLPSHVLSAYLKQAHQVDQRLSTKLVEANLNIQAQNAEVSHIRYQVKVDLAQAMLQIRADAARERMNLWLTYAKKTAKPWVVFIDHWDSLIEFGSNEAYEWVVSEFLLPASKNLPQFRSLLANSSLLPKEGIGEIALQIPLNPLLPEHSAILLGWEEVNDPIVRQFILERSGGNPFLIKLAAQLWKERPDLDLSGLEKELPVQAATEWILDQMSQRMHDPRSRSALEHGVVLEWFNRDVLAYVCEAHDFSAEWYADFSRYPFVENVWKRAGRKQFVRLVRKIKVNALWQQDIEAYHHLHQNARDWFTTRAEEGER